MQISFKWLQSMVDCNASPDDIAHRLTMAGLEVEAIESFQLGLDGIVVGLIQEMEKHPYAEHLQVCKVQIPDNVLKVVCGAPNAAEGQIVPLALEGASLVDGNKVHAAEIHGVLSQGMICSERELGLGEDASGIMVLDSSLHLGTPLAEALELTDLIYHIGVTPNRGDCLSVIGIAREVAALCGENLSPPAVNLTETGPPVESLSSVTIEDADLCPRYAARIVRNIKIKPSPLWMRQR
ncbi:MAG: phenylalanine--tRNA ligase subunit beta, partial [Deltaproteobacteria bacterium]|nr:phenylalanine--tRNA ligase subunit beta [Deltaproteobacteria bacterium]